MASKHGARTSGCSAGTVHTRTVPARRPAAVRSIGEGVGRGLVIDAQRQKDEGYTVSTAA
jgi:hypothetical protein